MNPFLSVIIPAFNEEKRIPTMLSELLKKLKAVDFSYEVIIVNDGSTDRTENIIKMFESNNPFVALLSYPENKGKGVAVKTGMLSAKGTWRLFMDADNSTSFDEFTNKIKPLLSQTPRDIYIGSRYREGSSVVRPQIFYRRILRRGGNLVFKILFFGGISDINCGFKCFSKEAAEKIFPKIRTNRWVFDDEVLVLAKSMGLSVYEIPVTWRDVPHHSTLTFFDYLVALINVIQIKLRSLRERKPSPLATEHKKP